MQLVSAKRMAPAERLLQNRRHGQAAKQKPVRAGENNMQLVSAQKMAPAERQLQSRPHGHCHPRPHPHNTPPGSAATPPAATCAERLWLTQVLQMSCNEAVRKEDTGKSPTQRGVAAMPHRRPWIDQWRLEPLIEE